MKNIFFLLVFFMATSLQALDVSITHSQFRNGDQSYIEMYFHYVGNTLNYLPVNENPDQLQSKIQALILIKKGEQIFDYDKYELLSPYFSKPSDFQDVKRFVLPEGSYTIEVEFIDGNNIESRFTWNKELSITPQDSQRLAMSDLQLLASVKQSDGSSDSKFSKSGFQFEVLPFDFLHSKYADLNLYCEFYNLDETQGDLYVSYGIKSDFYLDLGPEISRAYKKLEKGKSVVPYLNSIDIKSLRSGNYHVFIELVNKDKELLTSAHYDFQRSNPVSDFEFDQNKNEQFEESFVEVLDADSLNYYLRAHLPVARKDMVSIINSLVRSGSDKSKRYYLYKHWTDVNEAHAGALFKKYMEVADALDKMYNSGFGYGFETDRGYIFLRYGRPTNQIEVNDEPSAPPYEIWAYDVIADTGQTNVKFIFYNPSLSHNAFDLLHSTCRGETFFAAWETELYKNAVTEDTRSSIDATSVPDNIGRNARRLFEDI